MSPLPRSIFHREPVQSGRSREPQMDLLFPAAAETRDFIRPALRVRELVAEIRGRMEREYRDVRVLGEISNLRQASSGHIYFTLRDDQSQIPVVLFRGKARLLKFAPKDGLEVEARGAISVYEDRGQLQLVAETLEPRGKGSLQIAFEQLYARLREEGLFDAERKRPLPAYPRVIGVVTSAGGAVIHDILHVLARRHAKVQVLLYPAAVQGEAAVAELVEALAWFGRNQCADIVVLARGGGSLEDLAAFNSEMLARTIAAMEIPVVSAVGHETDFTIADFAADLRAPTPSAAAELITDAQYRVEERLAELTARLERGARYQRMRAQEALGKLDTAAVFARIEHNLARRAQRVDELRFRLDAGWERQCAAHAQRAQLLRVRLMQQDVRRQMTLHGERLSTLQLRLAQASDASIERRRMRLERAHGRLGALSPLAVLERGYALVYREGDTLVKQAGQLMRGDALRIRFGRGHADARVLETDTIKSDKDSPTE